MAEDSRQLGTQRSRSMHQRTVAPARGSEVWFAPMSPLAVLAFISPVFGLRLDLDPGLVESAFFVAQLEANVSAAEQPPEEGAVESASATEDAAPSDATTSTDAEPSTGGLPIDELSPETAAATSLDPVQAPTLDIAGQMSRRARIARAHKRLGIATWGAMTATVITGTLQYANLYGFFAPLSETRCVRGNAFYGQRSCSGTPIPHVSTTAATVALYYTTFGLSYAMPDPIGLDRGDSESARTLRQHKRMRWIHFGGMALQGVLGAFVANPQLLGMNRYDDYRALQALATVHLLSGYATYGVLTYTGARMAF